MADKVKVLVVGIGNSGVDIACELSRFAKRTVLSTRRGAHVIPKYLLGKPLDHVYVRGLKVIDATTIATQASDHNPMQVWLSAY